MSNVFRKLETCYHILCLAEHVPSHLSNQNEIQQVYISTRRKKTKFHRSQGRTVFLISSVKFLLRQITIPRICLNMGKLWEKEKWNPWSVNMPVKVIHECQWWRPSSMLLKLYAKGATFKKDNNNTCIDFESIWYKLRKWWRLCYECYLIVFSNWYLGHIIFLLLYICFENR